MGSVPSDGTAESPQSPFKILVAGGFGAGKTTLVGAISEVRPLRTEEPLTSASIGFDDLDGVDRKTSTTVAMDFGRITIGSRPGAVPVRHAGPGAVLVHVGRAGLRRARRRGAGRHPPARATASPRWTTSRSASCRSSSPSTASTARPATTREECGSRSTSTRACRRCCATPASRVGQAGADHAGRACPGQPAQGRRLSPPASPGHRGVGDHVRRT